MIRPASVTACDSQEKMPFLSISRAPEKLRKRAAMDIYVDNDGKQGDNVA